MATNQTRAVIDLVINGSSAQTTMRQVSNGVRALRRELIDMAQADNPALYAQRSKELNKMLATQRQMRAEVQGTATDWQKISGQIGTITAGLLGGNILSAIPAQIGQASRKIVEYRDSLSDVQKTTGMTKDEVHDLNEELKKIDTRTATADLRAMAATGGQFGIAKDDIEEFTVAADELNVALGDQLGGAEATAETVVKLRNIFKDLKTDDVGADMLHIGNAINVLEAAGAATAPVIADLSSRIGGVAIPMGMSAAQVLGLSGALQEMNVTAERGGSAVTDILMVMAKAPEAFAGIARGTNGATLSGKQFTSLVKTDLMGALMAVARGLNSGDTSATGLAAKLKDMGIDGNSATEVLMKMATNTDLVTEKINLMVPAVKDASSISAEFSVKNDQLARDLKTLDETFQGLYTSQAVQDFIGGAVRGVVQFLKVLPQAVHWVGQHTQAIWTFLAAMAVLNAQLLTVTLRTGYQTVAMMAQKVAYEVGFRWLVLTEAATAAYSAIMAATTIRTRVATAVQLLWNLALNANPIGLVITAVTGLLTAIKYFSEHSARAIQVQRQANAIHSEAAQIQKNHTIAQTTLNDKLGKWNELSVTERAELEKTMLSRRASLKLRLLELQAKIRENALAAAPVTAWQSLKIQASNLLAGGVAEQEMANRRDMLKQEQENMHEATAGFQAEVDALQQQATAYDDNLKKIADLKSGKKAAAGTGSTGDGTTYTAHGKDKKGKKEDPFRAAMDQEFGYGNQHDDTLSEYEKESMAFAQRFTKLYVLAGNNLERIKEVDQQNMAAWAIVEANEDKRQKDAKLKKKEKDDKTGYDTDLKSLDLISKQVEHQTTLGQVGDSVSEEVKQQTRLQLQQTYLENKLALQRKYAQDTTDVEGQLTANLADQEQLRAESAVTMSAKVEAARRAQMESDKQLYAEGVEALAGFVSENTVAYKALIVAAKAFAIAEIIINTQRQISQIWADPKFMLLGFGGIGAQVAATALASARAAGSIAKLSGLAGREEGGYTGMDDLYVDKSGSPGGFVNRPTLFALGQRSYVAGEGSKQEYVIPYPMLKKPAVANTVAMLEAMRTGRAYAKGGSTAMAGVGSSMLGITGGSAASGSADYSEAILHELRANRAELKQNRMAMEAYASRPIVNDYLAQEREQQWVQHIRNEVGV